MSNVYFFETAFMFVKSLIGIFIPLYLYSLGFSLFLVILFVTLVSGFKLLFTPLAIQILNKIGFKWTLFISIPVYLGFLYFVNIIELSNMYYIISFLLLSLYTALFWPAMQAEIAYGSQGDNKKIGNLQMLITLVTSLAPVIGGFILEFYSYKITLVIAFILLLFASIPLLMSKDIPLKKIRFNYRTILSYFYLKNNRTNKPFIGEGVEGVLVLVIAPLIFFILLEQSFAKLGFILTLISYLTIVFVFFYKNYIIKFSKRKSLKTTSKIFSVNWFFRSGAFYLGGPIIFVAEAIDKMLGKAFFITYMSVFFDVKDRDKLFEYIMQREIIISVSKFLFGLFILLLIIIFKESIQLLIFILLIGIYASLLKGVLADISR